MKWLTALFEILAKRKLRGVAGDHPGYREWKLAKVELGAERAMQLRAEDWRRRREGKV